MRRNDIDLEEEIESVKTTSFTCNPSMNSPPNERLFLAVRRITNEIFCVATGRSHRPRYFLLLFWPLPWLRSFITNEILFRGHWPCPDLKKMSRQSKKKVSPNYVIYKYDPMWRGPFVQMYCLSTPYENRRQYFCSWLRYRKTTRNGK